MEHLKEKEVIIRRLTAQLDDAIKAHEEDAAKSEDRLQKAVADESLIYKLIIEELTAKNHELSSRTSHQPDGDEQQSLKEKISTLEEQLKEEHRANQESAHLVNETHKKTTDELLEHIHLLTKRCEELRKKAIRKTW